jgi:hypothetical protein
VAEADLGLVPPGAEGLEQPSLPGGVQQALRQALLVDAEEGACGAVGGVDLELRVEQERRDRRLLQESPKGVRIIRRFLTRPPGPARPDHDPSIGGVSRPLPALFTGR